MVYLEGVLCAVHYLLDDFTCMFIWMLTIFYLNVTLSDADYFRRRFFLVYDIET